MAFSVTVPILSKFVMNFKVKISVLNSFCESQIFVYFDKIRIKYNKCRAKTRISKPHNFRVNLQILIIWISINLGKEEPNEIAFRRIRLYPKGDFGGSHRCESCECTLRTGSNSGQTLRSTEAPLGKAEFEKRHLLLTSPFGSKFQILR